MRNLILSIYLMCSISFSIDAQEVIGKVLDAKTQEELAFANVFINNTTIGTVSDTNGYFSLKLPNDPGSYELVFSFVGYETYKMKINIDNDQLNVGSIKLKPSEIQLNAVEVTSSLDKKWERKLKKFKKAFLGDDQLGSSCTIVNPWVIDFPDDKSDGKFIAKAKEPIEIENDALGFKIIFYLTDFWQTPNEYSIVGNALFTELNSNDPKKIENWRLNRVTTYQRSVQHLFKAIVEHRIGGEGFTLYRDAIDQKDAIVRSSLFYSDVGKAVLAYDTSKLVVSDSQKGFYKISLKGRIEVHDSKERASRRVYQDVFGLVSWLTLRRGFVIVNKNGYPKNPTDVIISGDMSKGRVASMLPLDYKPGQVVMNSVEAIRKTNASKYQEQVYMHTDKPYYYPGETIWFKGYINYGDPDMRDSLSRTVYVELIDREEKIVVMTKTLEIINGFFDNDFRLPDDLPTKTYYLRAYTNFNRNFGDVNLYIKPLPVLNLTEKLVPDSETITNKSTSSLLIEATKKVYGTREKITLQIKLKDDDENPLAANLSIAVVDDTQVSPITSSGNILEDYPIKESSSNLLDSLPYQVEYGINFSGQFLNEKNKPQKAMLNVLQLNPRNFALAQADDNGLFSVGGLFFYDSASFSILASDNKGKQYGSAKFIERIPAAIEFKPAEFKPKLVKTESPQRIFSNYEIPKDARVLEEVVIKSNKVEEQYDLSYRVKRPYGKPDFVLKAKDLNTSYGNLLLTLPGKIPGLIVREVTNDGEGTKWIVYLQREISISNPSEVLVTVNNAFVAGSPADILATINPNTVESIEVKKGVNVLYGSVGGNGILAIYTNDVAEQVREEKSISVLKVIGYSKARNFLSPYYDDKDTDKSQADYRSTLYWNPNVITDSQGTATVSFFAADLPGRYRIEVEGVTEHGEPIRSVYFVEVEN
jgi:hypothetical protein